MKCVCSIQVLQSQFAMDDIIIISDTNETAAFITPDIITIRIPKAIITELRVMAITEAMGMKIEMIDNDATKNNRTQILNPVKKSLLDSIIEHYNCENVYETYQPNDAMNITTIIRSCVTVQNQNQFIFVTTNPT